MAEALEASFDLASDGDHDDFTDAQPLPASEAFFGLDEDEVEADDAPPAAALQQMFGLDDENRDLDVDAAEALFGLDQIADARSAIPQGVAHRSQAFQQMASRARWSKRTDKNQTMSTQYGLWSVSESESDFVCTRIDFQQTITFAQLRFPRRVLTQASGLRERQGHWPRRVPPRSSWTGFLPASAKGS